MKRTIKILLSASLAITLLPACHPKPQTSQKQIAQKPMLTLEATTKSVLENADKVETFRLADFHDAALRTEAEYNAIEKQKYGTMRTYTVTRKGKVQNAAFAREILAALEKIKPNHFMASCFDPGVGFRVWKGKTKTEIFICFACPGVEIVTSNEKKKEIWSTHLENLGDARKTLLALSRRAFPDDKILRDLKE